MSANARWHKYSASRQKLLLPPTFAPHLAHRERLTTYYQQDPSQFLVSMTTFDNQNMLTLITPSGRNKHGQRLVKATCACGNVFEARHDNIKSGKTTSCGHCGKPEKKPSPKVEQKPEQKIVLEIASNFKRGTPQWFDDEIARIDAAATASENRARFLETEIAAQESTDLPTHKCWSVESTTAHKMREAIARLQIAKANAETATVKTAKTQVEINREKIAALRGGQ
jgi:hypothetical protein